METWQIVLEYIGTVGQFLSIAIVPIAVVAVKEMMANNAKKQENAQADADQKREDARKDARKDREAIEKKLDDIYQNVMLNNASSKSAMRYMLQRRHAEYMMQGYVTSLQLDEFNHDWETYAAQGGNGTGHKWHDEVNALPIDDTKHPENFYLELMKKYKESEPGLF